jgi:nucleotide-binding universal stress UspA family protein
MMILCAIDGSRYARWALELLRRLRFGPDSGLLLVHVVDVDKFTKRKGLDPTVQAAMKQALELADLGGQDMLQHARAIMAPAWRAVQTKVVRGHPAEAITRTASRRHAGLIVVGSRGLTEFRPFLLGSVSRRVVVYAPCPVLIVKKRHSTFRRILVAVDGSKEAHRAVDFLLQWPLPQTISLSVLSVVPPLPIETGSVSEKMPSLLEQVRGPLEREAHRVALKAVDHIRRRHPNATVTVAHGHPGQEIVKLAKSVKADLVVVGSRGLTNTDRYLMGSVSDTVVKYAPCSVLVVRHPRIQPDGA